MHGFERIKGKVSFASTKPAWHGLGTIVPNRMTSEEAIKLGNLNWTVEKFPIYADIRNPEDKTADPNYLKAPHMYGTVRTDINAYLGTVGRKYHVFQNTEAFKFFDELVEEGEALYETVGALGKGSKVFITAKLPEYMSVGDGDNIDKYLLLYNTHDGSGAVRIFFTPVRVVCYNTLMLALEGARKTTFSIRHSANLSSKIKEARNALNIVNQYSHEIEDIFGSMTQVKLEEPQLQKYLAKIYLSKEQQEIVANKGIKELSTRQTNIIGATLDCYYRAPGQNLATTRNTLYGAYNAVTAYMRYAKDYTDDTQLISLVEGNTRDTLKKAYSLANDIVNRGANVLN